MIAVARDFAAEFRAACIASRFSTIRASRVMALQAMDVVLEAALDAGEWFDSLGIEDEVLRSWYEAQTDDEVRRLLGDPACARYAADELARRARIGA